MANGRREYISISVLVLINLLNYIDRYTIAGVLTEVQEYYDITDSMAGLIQTVFLVAFMFGSPLCGYFGDRFNRKWIIFVGIIIWLGAVIASTFIPANLFWLFLVFRGIVGVGEASYSNIAPSLISDMFTGVHRSRMYMIFYFAIPVGSGLGFVIGSNVSSALDHWQWGVRVTAGGGVVALILHALLVHEPERGAADQDLGATNDIKTGYWEDLKSLIKIPTFISCTFAYTALIFVTGTLTWWMPTMIEHSIAWDKGLNNTKDLPKSNQDTVGLIFGAISAISGILGVMMGTLLAGWMKDGKGPFKCIQTTRSQPIVSGTGALLASPLLALVFLFGHKSLPMVWVALFIAVTVLSFNWGLNVDMLMSVIVPSRRSTAFSYFMLIAHLFGDASGPYIIGVISDSIRNNKTDPESQYKALVKASAVTVILLIVSAVLYFLTAFFLTRDQRRFEQVMGMTNDELKNKAIISEDDEKTEQLEDTEKMEKF